MPQAGTPTQTGAPALEQGPRIRWPTTLRLLASIVILTWIVTLTLIDPPGPPWTAALLIYLGLRAAGDYAGALHGASPRGSMAEALLKATSWGFVPLGVQWSLTPPTAVAPTGMWLVGLMVLLFGLGLAAHHERARERTPRIAMVSARLGLTLSVPGATLAATGLPLAGAWLAAAVLATAAVALALALFAMPRAADASAPASGWRGWWARHRMRLTLLVVLVAAYLPARRTIAEAVGAEFLPFWEYVAAVALISFLLWSLRSHLKAVSQETPLSSPHRRHEPHVERVSEEEMDAWEDAFGAFLADGDTATLKRLTRRLEATENVPAKRIMQPLLTYRAPDGILLVHPVWPYLATLGSLLVLFLALAQFAAALEALMGGIAHLLAPAALAVGLYATQFNRHGGPWWVKTLLGYAGLAMLPLVEISFGAVGIIGPLSLLLHPLGLPIAAALLLIPLTHGLRSRRARSASLYLYRGDDPLDAVRILQRRSERALGLRSLWGAVIAIPVFLLTGEIAQHVPLAAAIVPLYILLVALLLVPPLILSVGLRLGRRHVARLAAREERERGRRHDAAVTALTRALEARE